MNVYLSNCTDFENNGLGFLTDILNANVTEEINGAYSLYFEYILNGHNSEFLVEENIVKCNSGTKENQLFRIKKVIKDFNVIKVYAFHIFYDLKDNFLDDTAPTNKTAGEFGNWILSKANFETPFFVESTISTSKSARYVRRNVAESFLGNLENSVVNLFKAELDRDNFKIRIVEKIGNDNGVKVCIGKNITGIEILTDISSTFTRLCPVGFDGLTLPEKYVDSPLISNYPTPKVAKIEFSEIRYDLEDENAFHDLEEVYQALRKSAQDFFDEGGDKPSINVKIDWIELSKTEEYKNYSNLERVKLGDTIHAEILGLEYETRIIKTVYNPLTETIDSFEIGAAKSSLSTTISNFEKKAEEIKPNEILAQAKENATLLLTSAMGGYVYKTQNELFIMDTNDPNTATKVWRWNLNGLGYSKSGIDGPYETAITQDGQIVADFITAGKLNTNLIEGYENLVLTVKNFKDNLDKIAKIELELEKIQLAVSDSFDLTVSVKGENAIELSNVADSEPVLLRIYPTKEDISYLYLRDDLFLSDDLFLPSRTVIFENTTTKKKTEYELPCDLLVLDGIYDEFILNSSARECKAIKRIGINSNGEKYILDKPKVESFDYPNIELSEGNYVIYLLSFDFAYFECSAITINPYSEQFVPRITYESGIKLTKEYIDEQVKLKLGAQEFESYRNQTATLISEMVKDEDFQTFRTQTSNNFSQTVKNGEVISSINQSAEQLKINANKINITANDILNLISNNTINLKSRNIVIQSDNFNVTANGTLTAKNVDISGKITATSGSFTGKITANAGKIGGFDINSTSIISTFDNYRVMIGNASNGNKDFLVVRTGTEATGYKFPFWVHGDGSLYAEKATIKGAITATSGSFTGTITSNAGKIANWNISANKIYGGDADTGVAVMQLPNAGSTWVFAAGGTSHSSYSNCPFRVSKTGDLYATKVHISGGSVSGSLITSGINANNLTSGSVTSCNIDIYNGTGFLRMLNGSAYHPFVSALNVARGSGGVVFRDSGDRTNTGTNIGQIYADSNVIYISASNGTNVANYLKCGNIGISGNQIDGYSDTYIRLNYSVVLKPNPNGGAYVWGTEDYNKILTSGGSPSTLSVKEYVNEKDTSDIPEILKSIKLYDYKYIDEIENGKDDYGYIIDYLEQIPNIKKYLKFYDAERNGIKFKQLAHEQISKFLLGAVVELQKEIEELKSERRFIE